MNETLKRSLSGAVYILVLLFSVLYGTTTFYLLFGSFLLIAVFEFCSLTNIKKAIPMILAGSSYFLFAKFQFSSTNDWLLLMATLAVSIKCMLFLFGNEGTKKSDISKYIFLLGYVIFPFIIITKIPFINQEYDPKTLIVLFVLIWSNDTFAYLIGKSFGKTKLLEKISPKKTIEGFLGGLFFASIAGALLSIYYLENNPIIGVSFALIAGTFGTLGDLVESKFKRVANVKDSGKIMPGHGGILDRLDSVIFAAPYIYLILQIINYVS